MAASRAFPSNIRCRFADGDEVFRRFMDVESGYANLSTNQETVLAAMYETVKEWDEESKK